MIAAACRFGRKAALVAILVARLRRRFYGRGAMSEPRTKGERRADREVVGAYHAAEQAKLLEHVRGGFQRYDAGEIDAFELDELIHHYHRSTQKLWRACVVGGADTQRLARLLEQQAAEGDSTDWWALGEPRRR